MPQPEDPRHNLRLTPELKKMLQHAAVDNGRSVNAEILDRLDKSFAPSPMQNLETLLRNILTLSEDERADVAAALGRIASILEKR